MHIWEEIQGKYKMKKMKEAKYNNFNEGRNI